MCRNTLSPTSGSKEETSVKAVGKQSNRLSEISEYVGSKKEVEDKSVPPASPVGHNKLPVPIGCHTQPSEAMGDKNRINALTLKM
jgi:hypothetical protein